MEPGDMKLCLVNHAFLNGIDKLFLLKSISVGFSVSYNGKNISR